VDELTPDQRTVERRLICERRAWVIPLQEDDVR
jgi:hypothetical protein